MLPSDGTWNDFTSNGGEQNNNAEGWGEGSVFPYYINGTRQTANGTPTRVNSALNGRQYTPETGDVRPWFPMTGIRTKETAEFYNSGNYGRNWSSTAIGSLANSLTFSVNRITPNYASYIADGQSVRCLQE
jgi:hypothetical protein